MGYCLYCGELDLPVHKPHCIYRKGEDMSYVQKKAYIMIGPSGSGKSTVRAALTAKHAEQEVRAFSLDDCRIKFYLDNGPGYAETGEGLTQGDLYGKAFDFAKGKEFDTFVEQEWLEARKGQVVIVDNVHGTRKSRKPWVDALKRDKFHITMVQIQTPLEVILERQNTRGDKKVPEYVVRQMYMRQEEAMVGSECDSLLVIDGTKPIHV